MTHQVPHYRTSKKGKKFPAGLGKKKVKAMRELLYEAKIKAYHNAPTKRLKEMLPPRVGGAKFNPFGVNTTMRHTRRGLKQDRKRKSFSESWEHGRKYSKIHVKEHWVKGTRRAKRHHVKAYWRHV